jgi:hypothetical protein
VSAQAGLDLFGRHEPVLDEELLEPLGPELVIAALEIVRRVPVLADKTRANVRSWREPAIRP